MEKYFNIAGPCFPSEHYMLPALDRMPEVRRLVAQRQYFVIHAPRQTGKTTAVKALAREINAKGEKVALYCTLETLQNATDVDWAMKQIRGLLERCATAVPAPPPVADTRNGWCVSEETESYAVAMVSDTLTQLCRRFGKPLVVFFDEADCLFGRVLITFLRQLRDGYVNREEIPFPASIALIGMLDVRDYKAQIRPDGESLGQISPFNIITKDLMLRNFTEEEVAALYAQHTEATGQVFEPAALAKVWEFTCGQPWLVNALARECIDEIHDYDYAAPITADDIETAKEAIIRRRDTHVDSLMERLREPRVRRVVEPVIFGGDRSVSRESEDWRYVVDLGLLKENAERQLVPSNRMYAEIIGRYLTRDTQDDMVKSVPQTPWALPDGLDMPGLMAAFQSFWRENSGVIQNPHDYREALPHLVLMAFLQRVTNGNGHIIREMALGSERLDICVEYRGHRYAVEVKTSNNFAGGKSYGQLAKYLDTLGLAEGWMAIFDEDKAKPWEQKLFTRDETFDGKTLHVIGL
jgi:DNA polymerase III delta prime subunit